jgi:hypothetical protein
MSSLGRVGILVKKRLRSVLQLVLPKAEKRHHEAPAAGSRSGEGVLLDARELGGMGAAHLSEKGPIQQFQLCFVRTNKNR